jgi:2-methylcitrate dehydratase
MDQTLAALTEFVHATDADAIPAEVLDRARDILVDTLGCAIGGRASPAATVAEGLATPAGDGVVIGRSGRTAPEVAAFWNSAMIRYLDFNDSGATGGHPSDMIGAHVALSGLAGATGADLLTAVVIGHEVYNRLSDRLLYDDRRLDHGYATAVGVAAAGAKLLGLDRGQTQHALAIAANSSLALRAVRAGQLSHMKGFATALGAKDGVFHLQLAQAGLTGPAEPFDGRHGIVELTTGEAGPLGLPAFDTWTLLGGKLKYWPAAYNTQPAIWAALELRGSVAAEHLASVTLGVNKRAWHESGSEAAKWDPRTRETADHSIPYLFARAFLDGVVEEASFTSEKLEDPDVRALMAKVDSSTASPETTRCR